jgi:predicted enzyme related to lactoylglutathione lyase
MAASPAGIDRPVWVDLSSSNPTASHAFYSAVFGWEVVVSPDPQYGGYAMARVDGHDVAGIGPSQPGAPTAWALYIGTEDAAALGAQVEAAGGRVIVPAFDVGDTGRMAVFQDPSGAFISAWQSKAMAGFHSGAAGTYQWAELNARGFDRAAAFYREVFSWAPVTRDVPGAPPYTEFQLDGVGLAGGMEMSPMVPAEIPSYWMVYFSVADIDDAFAKVLAAGGREMVAPTAFPGGRFAIVADPQGAMFALHQAGGRVA